MQESTTMSEEGERGVLAAAEAGTAGETDKLVVLANFGEQLGEFCATKEEGKTLPSFRDEVYPANHRDNQWPSVWPSPGIYLPPMAVEIRSSASPLVRNGLAADVPLADVSAEGRQAAEKKSLEAVTAACCSSRVSSPLSRTTNAEQVPGGGETEEGGPSRTSKKKWHVPFLFCSPSSSSSARRKAGEPPSAATQPTPLGLNRYLLLLLHLLYVFASARLLFGWPNLSNMLFRSGAFAWLCDDGSSPAAAGEGRNQSTRYLCRAQDSAVQLLFTIGMAVSFCCSLLSGCLMDWRGPRLCAVVGQVLNTTAWILFAVASESCQTYFPAVLCLALGADAGYLPSVTVSSLFPGHEGLVVVSLSAAMSASFSIPTFMDISWRQHPETLSFKTICLLYAGLGSGLCALLALFVFPVRPYATQEEIRSKWVADATADNITKQKKAKCEEFANHDQSARIPSKREEEEEDKDSCRDTATAGLLGCSSASSSSSSTSAGVCTAGGVGDEEEEKEEEEGKEEENDEEEEEEGEDDGEEEAVGLGTLNKKRISVAGSFQPREGKMHRLGEIASPSATATPLPRTDAAASHKEISESYVVPLKEEIPAARPNTEEKGEFLPFRRQLLSPYFLCFFVYWPLNALYYNFYLTSAENMFNSQVIDLLGILGPLSMIPAVLLGKLSDNYGVMSLVLFISCSGVCMYFFALLPGSWAYIVSACFSCLYISNFSGQMYAYMQDTFLSSDFGKVVGMTSMAGGLLALTRIPLHDHLTVSVLHGNYRYACGLMLAITLFCLLLALRLFFLKRKMPKAYYCHTRISTPPVSSRKTTDISAAAHPEKTQGGTQVATSKNTCSGTRQSYEV